MLKTPRFHEAAHFPACRIQVFARFGCNQDEQYSYDDLNRLSTVDYGDGQTQGYSFDAMGNRLSRTDSVNGSTSYAFNAANMLTTLNGNTGAYTNDANGNTLTGGGRTNTWDSQNRLTSSTVGGVTSTYTYGADGLRRSSTVNGITTDYVYDGQNMVEELRSGAVYATYLTGPRGPEYRRDANGAVSWYVYDGLGSVVAEVAPDGTVTASEQYDVYGALRGGSGAGSTTRHHFVGGLGHIADQETGLIYMRERYYDPALGRFESEDPDEDGINWYVYCDNNPITGVDFSGLNTTGDADLDYNSAVINAGFGIMATIAVVIGGYQLAQSEALDGIYLTKGAKRNNGNNQRENAITDQIASDCGLTKDESDRLHRDISKRGMDEDEIRDLAKDLVLLRGGKGGKPGWKK